MKTAVLWICAILVVETSVTVAKGSNLVAKGLGAAVELAARRCAICEFVVEGLDKRIRDDFRNERWIHIDGRLQKQKKPDKGRVPYGLSELGFLEHLEETCSRKSVLSALLMEKKEALKLADVGITDEEDPRFQDSLFHASPELGMRYLAACRWFVEEYEETLNQNVRHWNRATLQTEAEDGSNVEDFVNLDGGTTTMIWNLCHRITRLCPEDRWGRRITEGFDEKHGRQRHAFLQREGDMKEL